ncbi:MAG: DEAD/DEAH box helicase [Verrucomicrobiales bacterium]
MKIAPLKPVTEDRFEFGYPPEVVAAGKLLLQNNAVKEISIIVPGQAFEALVEDVFTYKVEIEKVALKFRAECPCSLSSMCPHRYAAVRYLIENNIFLQPGESAPVESVSAWYQRKVPKVDAAVMKRLQSLDALHNRALRGSVPEGDISLAFGFFTSFRSIRLSDYGPLGTPEDFLHAVQCFLVANRHAVPAFLSKVTDRAKISAMLGSWTRTPETKEWHFRLKSLTGAESQTSRELTFQIQVHAAGFNLLIQRKEDGPFEEFQLSRTREIMNGIETGKYIVQGESQIIWENVAPMVGSYYWGDFKWSYPQTKTLLNRFLRRPELNGHIYGPAGTIFSRAEDPLRLEMSLEGESYRITLVQADGAPAPKLLAILPGRPSLYVTQKTIYPGPSLPEFMVDSSHWEIPRAAVETSEGIQALTTLGIPIPPSLEQKLIRVQSRLSLHGSLVKLEEAECFSLKVKFSSADGSLEEGFNGDWISYKAASPAAQKDASIHVYDSSKKAHAPAIVAQLDLKWDNYMGAWRRKITRNFPEKFLEWRASLPSGIDLHLDPFFQTLIKEPVKAQVELNCKESGVDWFDLNLQLKVSDTRLTKEEIRMLLNAKGGYVRMGDKGFMRLELELSEEEQEAMARLGLSPTEFSSEPQRLHALQLSDKAANRLLPQAHAAKIERRIEEIKTRVMPDVPAAITAELRPYQLEGFHFLAYLSENNFGGILADDMGLGKTIQTLAWLAWLRDRPADKANSPNKPSLVVCPKSVMDNWKSETEKFLPSLKVTLGQGLDPKGLKAACAETDLLVLNYAQLRNASEELIKLDFQSVILDEGQYIKNPASQTAQAARMLRSSYRLVLSGTPIENRLLDLWSLMSFAMPGALGNQTYFQKVFNEKGDSMARKRLAARVRPFLLRRTKNQVAQDLPDRVEEDLFCEMESKQKKLYKAELKRARIMLLGIKTSKELQQQRFNFLTSLLRLRQICCHPLLVDATFPKNDSAKLGAFLDLIEPLMEEGQKVLVFSQFVTMLEILRKEFVERGWAHYYLAGDTEDRGALVKQFQNHDGAATFLISLKAGGFGLNLTSASYVVLFDPWWNPAVENQAIDRTHRIGQKNKVIAYRLLIKGSIEEKIRGLQKQKSSLAEGVLGDESFNQQLSLEDFQYLFSDDAD